jgi:two-component system, NarL family, sensor kinase
MQYSSSEILVYLVCIGFFVLLMITFIIMILFFIQKNRKGFESDLTAVKLNHEKELYKVQMEIQEQTFKQISREIHDNVGQMLSLAKLGINTLDTEKKEYLKDELNEISDLLEKSLDELRYMSRTMNSEYIKSGGLKKSIEMQVGFLKRGDKFKIDFNVSGAYVNLEETKEIILFRIVQEAINNIIRHACATDAHIILEYKNDFVALKIQDNGRGFHLNEKITSLQEVNGIYNMQHRAKIIDAVFEIESEPGTGTTIMVKTPY